MSRRPAVWKKVEIIDAPILGPVVHGAAPTLPQRDPLADEIRDLALGDLADGFTDADRKE